MRNKLILILFVLCAFAMGKYLKSDDSSHSKELEVEIVQDHPSSHHEDSSDETLDESPTSQAGITNQDQQGWDENSPELWEARKNSPEVVLREALERDPLINEFYLLNQLKLVKNAEEKAYYKEFLTAPENIKSMIDTLQQIPGDISEGSVQMTRLLALDFLRASAKISDEQKKIVIHSLQNYVLKDMFGPEQSVEVRKILAAEKWEALASLEELDETLVDSIVKSIDSPVLAKVVASGVEQIQKLRDERKKG